MIEKVKVYSDQNIVDLAIQEHGSIDGFVAFAKRNGLAVDANPVTDSILEVESSEVTNTTARTFYKNNNLVIATARVNNTPYPSIFDKTFDETFE